MKKLSKAHVARRNVLAFEMTEKIEAVGQAIMDLNHAIDACNEFVEEVHSEQDDYSGERSDAWRDGDAGTAYADWMTEWEFSMETLDDPTEDVDLDSFESLPESPS
jgi:hypothetical protein